MVSVDVRREFSLNEQDYSHAVMLFLFAYAIMYAGSGYVFDRLGTKLGLAVLIFELVGRADTSCIRDRGMVLRGIPIHDRTCRTRATGRPQRRRSPEWFPARQRALGIGIQRWLFDRIGYRLVMVAHISCAHSQTV
jgi:MFS transporter, ACS family, hexuronate transporter